MAIETGQNVRQVVSVIEGTVSEIQYNNSTKSLEMLVEYVDAGGVDQQRWFKESELEVV